MSQYPETEIVTFYMNKTLYDELFESDVEPYDVRIDILSAQQVQFIQGMLSTEDEEGEEICLSMTNDGVEYLLRTTLPENLEMWYNWSTPEGDSLMNIAKTFSNSFEISCPY